MVQIFFDNSMTVTLFITTFLNFQCFVHISPKSHPNAFGALQAESTMYSGSNALRLTSFCPEFGELCRFFPQVFFSSFFPAHQLM